MPGFYIALVCIGNKEQAAAELIMPTLREYTQQLFNTAGALMGSRWLMIHVTDEGILDDVKRLIKVRRKIKSKGA
jgi:hypothetical protein